MPEETANYAPVEATDQVGLESVLAEYLRAVEAGNTPNEPDLLQKHPELAPELKSFFENRRQMEHVARPLRAPGDAARPGARYKRIQYLGDYELLDEIGFGGMGVIFKARQTSLQRIVAVKMVLDDRLPSPEDRQRFRIEAEAAASLEHPNILPIYEVGEHEGRQYFSMKLVEEGSLSQRLANGPLPVREAASLMITVARAVQFAHEHGILHRDLKPANILIDAGGEPFVADFGLAKRLQSESDLTLSGAVLGTPSYMAPEQAAGHNRSVTTGTDVYGLGAIFYAALTARAPFQGETVPDTLRQVLEREPQRPSSLNAEIDRDLETICLKALRKTPASRYATAQSLADDLERWLRGEPIQARPISRPARILRWCRRHPAFATAIGLGIIAGLSLVALAIGYPIALEQARLNRQLRKEQRNTQQALDNVVRFRNQAERLAAILALTQGLTRCEEGDAAQGLHWLGRALELSPSDEPALGAVIRKNITAWLSEVHVLEVVLPHEREIFALAVQSDGGQAAVGCWDRSVVLWDTATRTAIGEPLQHRSPVMALTFCHDRQWLATGCLDGSIWIWRLDNQQLLREWQAHSDQICALAFLPDDNALVSASKDSFVKRWETASGKAIGEPLAHEGPVTCLALSRDGKLLLTGGASPRLFRWNLSDEPPG